MENPGLFPSCAVTRSKTNVMIHPQTLNENLESEGSMNISCLFDESMSPSELCDFKLAETSEHNCDNLKGKRDVLNFNHCTHNTRKTSRSTKV